MSNGVSGAMIVGAFKSVCDALSVDFPDWINRPFVFPFSLLHLQFSLSLLRLPTQRTNKTSLAMIDYAPCLSLLRPSVDWGFRFGLEVRHDIFSANEGEAFSVRCVALPFHSSVTLPLALFCVRLLETLPQLF